MDNYLHFVAAMDVQNEQKEQEQVQSVEPWTDLKQQRAQNQIKSSTRFSGVLN